MSLSVKAISALKERVGDRRISRSEDFFGACEEIVLLELLLADDLRIDVVGEVGLPLDERMVDVGDPDEFELTCDACGGVYGVRAQHLVTYSVVTLTDLSEAHLPHGTILERLFIG